jgi:hypothetical protein
MLLADSVFAGWGGTYRRPSFGSLKNDINYNSYKIAKNKRGITQNKFHINENKTNINVIKSDIENIKLENSDQEVKIEENKASILNNQANIQTLSVKVESLNSENEYQDSKIYSNGIEVGTVKDHSLLTVHWFKWTFNKLFEKELLQANGTINPIEGGIYFENENCIGDPYLINHQIGHDNFFFAKKLGKVFAIGSNLYFYGPEETLVYKKQMLSKKSFDSCGNISGSNPDSLYLKLYPNDPLITGIPNYPLQNITIEGYLPLEIIE